MPFVTSSHSHGGGVRGGRWIFLSVSSWLGSLLRVEGLNERLRSLFPAVLCPQTTMSVLFLLFLWFIINIPATGWANRLPLSREEVYVTVCIPMPVCVCTQRWLLSPVSPAVWAVLTASGGLIGIHLVSLSLSLGLLCYRNQQRLMSCIQSALCIFSLYRLSLNGGAREKLSLVHRTGVTSVTSGSR